MFDLDSDFKVKCKIENKSYVKKGRSNRDVDVYKIVLTDEHNIDSCCHAKPCPQARPTHFHKDNYVSVDLITICENIFKLSF